MAPASSSSRAPTPACRSAARSASAQACGASDVAHALRYRRARRDVLRHAVVAVAAHELDAIAHDHSGHASADHDRARRRTRVLARYRALDSCLAHDLFGKSLDTFPDHALS